MDDEGPFRHKSGFPVSQAIHVRINQYAGSNGVSDSDDFCLAQVAASNLLFQHTAVFIDFDISFAADQH